MRVNDRGPFLHDRIIDLSYAAAHRIGVAQKGSGEVIVESVIPGDNDDRDRAAAGGRDARRVDGAAGAAVAARQPGRAAVEPAHARSPPRATGGRRQRPLRRAARRVPRLRQRAEFPASTREQVAPVAGEPRMSQVKGLWRVYVGPYDNEADAKRMGDRLYAALGIDNTVAQH